MATVISKSTVDAFGPQDRPALLWDAKLKGFGLRVMPSGVKSYIYQYRIGGRGSPTRRYTIGRHGTLTPDQARKIASELAAQVARKIDPVDEQRALAKAKAEQEAREAAKAQERVSLAFDAYVETFLARGLESDVRSRSREGYASALRNHAVPVLGNLPLPDITPKEVHRVLDAIPADQPAVRRIVFAVLRLLFKYARARDDIAASPLDAMKAPKPAPSRDRVLSDAELRLALRAAASIGGTFGPVYELLFATGQRRDEVARLHWEELDRDSEIWTLPAERSKNGEAHIIPLNRRAMAVLDRIAGQEGETAPQWPKRGLVFTSRDERPISGYSRAKARLDAAMLNLARLDALEAGDDPKEIEVASWRLHDARRTFATGMQKLGVRFEVTEAILNHVSGSRSGIAGVYQRHDWADEKRAALARWSDHLDQLLKPTPGASKVVPLHSAKR